MIRKQITNHNSHDDYDTLPLRIAHAVSETDETAKAIMDHLTQWSQKPDLKLEEVKDYDLMSRISAASEGDTTENRVKEARIKARVRTIEDDLRRAAIHNGQDEQEFRNEQMDAQQQYYDFNKRAWDQVEKEYKEGKI